MKKPEKECPQCKGKLSWKVVHNSLGAPLYNGLCSKCNIVFRGREAPEIARGKKLAENLKGIHCMDKQITSLPCDVQIGILRARQHCATCENSMGEPCTCDGKCNCLYCCESREASGSLL